jgi:hypothetical protein
VLDWVLVQISMATEITALKQEINNLRLHNERGPSSQTGNGTLETSSIEVSSRTHLLGGSVQKSTTFLQHEIYILGGLADTWLESVLVYSPATNQMRGAAPMLAPRSYAAASLLDSNIYLYGGGDGSSWSDSGMCSCSTVLTCVSGSSCGPSCVVSLFLVMGIFSVDKLLWD